METYGSAGLRDAVGKRRDAARDWLIKTTPTTTEERVFRLLALDLSGADDKHVNSASRDLLGDQGDDGGWKQLDNLEPDAYATGSALFALHQTGQLETSSPTYKKGLQFLLASQRKDGSWHVGTRSRPIQKYYESGFPHGKDQFISCAASAWATVALLQALPTELPKVLLVGDSISMGYTGPVQERLGGKADVRRIPANGGPTTRGLANIDKWLGETKWDLIHFNWGIHDLKHMPSGKRQVEPADYERNLRELVAKLKATGATLIWASTTPIPEPPLNPDRTFGDEEEYNAIAAKVMAEHGIPTNDLHGWIKPRFGEFHKPKDLHFKPEGYKFLAEKVASEIVGLLTAVPESS